ncbi:hypothetical protein RND81_13G066700 [Saponaria officinalis]|uniref:14-3-3 domain-containing protein n=1 Tax=Saponaria officinalis TaxID=3572 RepID=A0AAW1GZC5_SAPOF
MAGSWMREYYVYLAKSAKSSERYEETLEYMQAVVEISGGNLTMEEENLLTESYKTVMESRKLAQQDLIAMEENEVCKKKKRLILADLANKEEEIISIRARMIKTLKHLIPITGDISEIDMKMYEEDSSWPEFVEYGPFLRWVTCSDIHKIRVIKDHLTFKALFCPKKKFQKFLDAVSKSSQIKGQAELEALFESSIALGYTAVLELEDVHNLLSETQTKLKKKRIRLIRRRPLKPITIKIKGTKKLCYKTHVEKKCEKFDMVLDQMIACVLKLKAYSTISIVGRLRSITITSSADLEVAGNLKGDCFKGTVSIDVKFKLVKAAYLMAIALEFGFQMDEIIFTH